ncbi:multidrug efflux RND transporter permease subunit [Hyphomicrobium sp. CS1BSMeth3]|uniref:efflux RND transporter permease subunit n=1 Tax=Hyphomicrobium sp. CS1BSMeth3 TaxID=1892844 RepID=UPI00093022B3|nr:multidrug efflux RND transporter permease subunit [Hyphomicrobium sp. CS1BSMeth3]
MPISRFFIDRPIFAAVVSLFITIVGGIAYMGLPVTQFPEISPPTITVSATYPGAGAQTVADTVAAVIEQEINGVDGMIYMYSQSTQQGTMSITVTFDVGYDIDKAQVLVQNRVAAAEPRLPEEVRRSGVQVRKNSPDLLLVVHMVSPDSTYDQVYISNYALLNVRDVLARIPGVGEVNAFGAREYSMRVWLDPERIAALNLTAEEILGALRQQNVQVAGGSIGEPPMPNQGAFEQSLQLRGRLLDAREFEEIVIKTGADGRTVKLKDAARVELGAISYNTYGYMDRVPATVLAVTQAPGSDALKTASVVKDTMAQIAPNFPKGLEYRIIYNPTEFIEVSIKALMKTILEAIALVVLVIIIFLQTWRATLVPLLAIPISLIGTCAVMLALGYSINSLTLFGLVLSVGIVVDDAIVVVENVERRLREGLSPMEAARATMDEVGAALIAIALVLVAVFVPSAFVGGITGAFFRQFAVTIATATIISVFVSLTLSPSLCARLFKPHEDHDAAHHRRKSVGEIVMWPVHAGFGLFNRGFGALERGYGHFVRGLSWTAPIMLLVYAGLMAGSVMLVMATPTGFIPATDRGIVTISMTLPPGASIERTNEVFKEANDIILSTPGYKHTSGFVGRSGATFSNSSNAAALFSVLEDHDERDRLGLTIDSMTSDIRNRLAVIKDAQVLVFVPPAVRGMGNASGFSMRLQDRQALGSATLYKASQDLIERARQTPGISNIFSTFQISTPQVFVDVDRVKAQMLRVPVGTIFEALRVYMGSAYVNDFNMFGRPYKLVVQADAGFRADPDNVSRIRVRNADGQMVPLGSLVTFREISGPERVPRYNLFPTVEINGTAAPGVSSGQALDIMQKIAAEALPPGVTFEWTDLSYQEKKAGRTGYIIFALSVLFVFLALAAQYESWALPFSIILIVPMCLLAATFGVWMEGKEINILTQISFVVLIGLASKNAILIVEFARQQEEMGKNIVEATVEACRMRLRPIIMTSLAFTLGVVPLYMATGAGYEMRQALGIAVFWGMIGVTLFGLVFTPVFYIVIRKLTEWRRGRRAGPSGHGAASVTPAE